MSLDVLGGGGEKRGREGEQTKQLGVTRTVLVLRAKRGCPVECLRVRRAELREKREKEINLPRNSDSLGDDLPLLNRVTLPQSYHLHLYLR
jgi:hypothetical protein